jgi:hypothetical protein
MGKADPIAINDQVADKYFDYITGITKSFIDNSKENELFKKCSPFAPFLAWTS